MRELADELTTAHQHAVWNAEGELVTGVEYSLLGQLEEAIHSSSGRGSVSGAQATRSLVNLGALTLWSSIEQEVRVWEGGGSVDHTPLPARVRVWLYSIPEEEYAALVPTLLGWAQSIRNLLAPPKQVPLRGVSCRVCGEDTILTPDSAGEVVRVPALLVHMEKDSPWAECRSCGEEFPTRALYNYGNVG